LATDVLVENQEIKGVRALDCRTGTEEEFLCRHLILATGGAGRLFKYTTNSKVATADGVALAYRAGAEVMDVEFFQFHPTAVRLPRVAPFLISEAVRGEGGVLRNVEGHCFMADYVREADLAPRDVVARSIVREMRKSGSDQVFLDVTLLQPHVITTRFPQIYRFCQKNGLDITKDPIPVAPAAHYMMGGVRTNVWGETNIRGLFAAGETACTGVHGANRLASNSLLEVVVFSKRIVERTQREKNRTTQRAGKTESKLALSRRKLSRKIPQLSLSAVQSLLWDKVGIVRSGEGLGWAADYLAGWEQNLPSATDRVSYELRNLVLVGRLMTEAALIREESRGAHFRTDFSEASESWRRHIVFKSQGDRHGGGQT
jgi:L-aspartate oxidase